MLVVICFHSLIYWYFTQLSRTRLVRVVSCDLLSFFDLLIFHTAPRRAGSRHVELWFAFILWFIDISHSKGYSSIMCCLVVICFHSLIYWYFTQPLSWIKDWTAGCDLLSFFDLLIFHTATPAAASTPTGVVICFHSLIYWYFTQLQLTKLDYFYSCDLLSFFDLLIFHTAFVFGFMDCPQLWFAFILWFIDISHSMPLWLQMCGRVVICFHSLIYWYFTQPIVIDIAPPNGCDLLSFFDLLIFHTACCAISWKLTGLWFAFILWFIDISHSQTGVSTVCMLVVICFHSLIYWYFTQHLNKVYFERQVVICFHSLIYWYFTQPFYELVVLCLGCDLLSFFDLLIFHTAQQNQRLPPRQLWFAFILWFIDISHSDQLPF